MIAGALEGTVCIEVSGHVAGPYAGSLLGDLGCEVIKVELPNGGDTHRGRNPKYEGYGPSFRALNRNKKSLTLNLRDKKARGILLQLVATADILLENFRPPTRTQLGLDYEELAKLNPQLIHCSISGYGQGGPSRDEAAMDLVVECSSGFMSITGTEDGEQVRSGYAVADINAGLFASIGILMAVRETTRVFKDHLTKAAVDEMGNQMSVVLNSAVTSFHSGFRTYYYALAWIGWFFHPLVFMAATAFVTFVLVYRQIASPSAGAIKGFAALQREIEETEARR